MIDRIDMHPTPQGGKAVDLRSGKERRRMHTMLDPAADRRKGERRKNPWRKAG